MKGTISNCLLELLDAKYGVEKSKQIIEKAGLQKHLLRFPMVDIPDADFMKLFRTTLSETGLTLEQACDAFGEYWCCTYAPKMYDHYMNKFKNARELLMGMDDIHVQVTKNIANAKPPRFEYQWSEITNTLTVEYKSDRGLIDLYVGLCKGAGKYFKENLVVTKMSETKVKIVFK